MQALVARPTSYGRYRFRSLLEARWAYFLTLVGIPFLYEPKLYFLSAIGCYYLPDFYLPAYRCFLEIKGAFPEQREKMCHLARQTRCNVYTFYEDIGIPIASWRGAFLYHGDDFYRVHDTQPEPLRIRVPQTFLGQGHPGFVNAYGSSGTGYGWCECGACGMLALATTTASIRWQCACLEPLQAPHSSSTPLQAPHSSSTPRLLNAYQQANVAIFDKAGNILQRSGMLKDNSEQSMKVSSLVGSR